MALPGALSACRSWAYNTATWVRNQVRGGVDRLSAVGQPTPPGQVPSGDLVPGHLRWQLSSLCIFSTAGGLHCTKQAGQRFATAGDPIEVRVALTLWGTEGGFAAPL